MVGYKVAVAGRLVAVGSGVIEICTCTADVGFR